MGRSLFEFSIGLGGIAGAIAGLMAYIITYDEYARHLPDKGQARKFALQSGFVAFAFFLASAIVLGFLLKEDA